MIIITGMHRSGTSFTANMLHQLDVNFGEPDGLATADRWNPRGYFENVEFQIMHDLLVMGDGVPAREWRTTNPARRSLIQRLIFSLFRAQYILPRGKAFIARNAARHADDMRELGRVYAHAAIKDPRFSFCLAQWANVTHIDKILYCFRHPREVALSLRKRYYIPLWLGYRLWNTHVESFLEQAGGHPLLMINYNNFFNERPHDEVRRLYHFVGKPYTFEEADALLRRILDASLKRNVYRGEPVPEYVARQYARLTRLHDLYGDVGPYRAADGMPASHELLARQKVAP